MDAFSRPVSSSSSSLLALPTTPASGLQIFALFFNFFFPALALVVVSIRVAGRVVKAHLAIDDWLVCIAMLMAIAQTILSFFFIKANFVGIPSSRVPPHDPTQGLIWAYAVQILYNPILALVKSSVLIFLGRIFGQKDTVRKFLLWLNVANVSQMVAVFFAITLQCTPVAFNWDFSIRGGKCVDRRVLYTATAVFNIVMDLLILGTPVVIFWKLRIGRRTKIGLLGVFLLGFLVTITSIVRLILLVQGLFNLQVINDPTRNIGFITSGIETNLAIITASAPALRPIFRSREKGGWFGITTRTGRRTVNNDDDDRDRDLEAKPVGWDKNEAMPTTPGVAAVRGGKSGRRGGGRGGRLSSGRRKTAQQTKSGRGGGKLKPVIRVKTVGDQIELRSQSPRSSGEEMMMTGDGLRKMSDVRREVDGLVKEIGDGTIITGRKFYPSERYYSESIYPPPPPSEPPGPAELDLRIRDEERKFYYNEDIRVSRRYGVVTPREGGRTPTTATSKGWDGVGGRPF
ncbi:hypothetical protein QBC38DRAFT_368483 [Podospora fimiseda]|uniref:Rhodopsin domain-containing protein n=1 Tax=Podospora fimiseda TaxID=252190 RepID=A0AAN7GV70_9PEZI|nr:hypothetical protein QBC38DRAFT_368483 [Podospora fimiseda]